MIVACWRVLYGEDWIVQSLRSVLPFVDRAIIFWSDRPWGEAKEVTYLGQTVPIPWHEGKPFDGWVDRIREQGFDPKPEIEQFQFHHPSPKGYWTAAINGRFHDAIPDTLLLLECDHVWDGKQLDAALREFRANKYRAATSRQVEMWKGFDWRVPERPNRTGTVFWNGKGMRTFPPTRSQGEPTGTDFHLISAHVHNLGFCVSEKTMLMKHLTALAFSKGIGDSKPKERWFEDVWRKWEPGMEDLEIAEAWAHSIPRAIPYDRSQVPEVLRVP